MCVMCQALHWPMSVFSVMARLSWPLWSELVPSWTWSVPNNGSISVCEFISVISVFVHLDSWIASVQGICYNGNRRQPISAKRMSAFFDGIAVIMTRQLRDLAMKSLESLTKLIVPDEVGHRLPWAVVSKCCHPFLGFSYFAAQLLLLSHLDVGILACCHVCLSAKYMFT